MSFKVEVWISQQKTSIKCIIWPIEDNNVTKFAYTSINFIIQNYDVKRNTIVIK